MPTFRSYEGELSALLKQYQDRGRQEARNHHPPTDATHPDQHEVELRLSAEKHLLAEQRLFDARVTESQNLTAEVRGKVFDASARAQQLATRSGVEADVEAEMAGDLGALVDAKEARVRAAVELKAYKDENGIREEARYPESLIWHFAIVAVFMLVETGMNTVFFENAQGLLGGFVVALGVAFINMFGSMALGAGFRYKNLKAPSWQAFGWACIVLFAVGTIYMNGLFAAFRAEYQLVQDPSDAQQLRAAFAQAASQAKKVFVLDMSFADINSLVLFGLGVLLSTLACWKGYTIDDRHPRHGAKDRALRDAKRVEDRLEQTLRQRLKEFWVRKRGELSGAMAVPGTLLSQVTAKSAELAAAANTLRAQATAIQRDYKLVLNGYRQTNLAVRGTPPPDYFSNVDDLSAQISTASAEEQIRTFAEVQREIEELREQTQPQLDRKLQEYQALSAQTHTETIDRFFRGADEQARERLNRGAAMLAAA